MQGKISVSPALFIAAAAAVLILPVRWVAAWVLAVCIHEAGHYIALRLCRIPIFRLTVSYTGVRMETGELQGREAFFCALAGPIFGLCTVFLSRYLPCTAFCCWLQGMFNLLPVYPLDGGRALRAILEKLFDGKRVDGIEKGIAVFFAMIAIILGIGVGVGLLPLGAILSVFLQKFLAKGSKSSYNR